MWSGPKGNRTHDAPCVCVVLSLLVADWACTCVSDAQQGSARGMVRAGPAALLTEHMHVWRQLV